MMEEVGVPSSVRSSRAFESARRRAVDELAGRTVWCAAALPEGQASADRLRAYLQWAETGDVVAGTLEVDVADEPLRALAQRLDRMLTGAAASSARLGPADREIYTEGTEGSEALVGAGVGHDDVVVLHDALTAMLVEAIRERGAHAVWHVQMGVAPRDAAGEAWTFLRRYTPAVDAYLTTWSEPTGRGVLAERIAALMPSADVVAAKEIAAADAAADRRHNAAWSSVLADVVHADRGESVGGTLQARPAVPAR
jgi:hypothetical protein